MNISYVPGTTLSTWEATVNKRKFLPHAGLLSCTTPEAPFTLCNKWILPRLCNMVVLTHGPYPLVEKTDNKWVDK